MENGGITEYVRKKPDVDRALLLWDVASGLYYLHSHDIIHGDLNGATVLIDKDGHARLADFGLTSIIEEENLVLSSRDHSLTNMMTWAAPEILQGNPVSKEGDIFTFAMVAVETFTGCSPFGESYLVAIYDIMTGKRPKRPKRLGHDGLWEMVEKCWNRDPRKRPTCSKLVEFFRASFQRKRRIQEEEPLQKASSTRASVDTGSSVDGNTRPPIDAPKQDTREGSEPKDPHQHQNQVSLFHHKSFPVYGPKALKVLGKKAKAGLFC